MNIPAQILDTIVMMVYDQQKGTFPEAEIHQQVGHRWCSSHVYVFHAMSTDQETNINIDPKYKGILRQSPANNTREYIPTGKGWHLLAQRRKAQRQY